MSRDLDTIARRAAANLNAAVESALVEPRPLQIAPERRRPSLRLVLVTAALLLSSAVAVAVVTVPVEQEAPPTTTTTIAPAPSTTIFEPARHWSPLAPVVVTTTVPPTTTLPADVTPPLLEIGSPDDGAEVHEKEIKVSGSTEPGAEVRVGEREAEVGPDGEWSIWIALSKGANEVEATARDAAGNKARAAITVHYVVVESTTTTTKPKEEVPEFVANATFGVCTLTPPYDVYYGKGKPGSVVYVQSEYGSGSTTVNENGEWEVQVFFPEAPAEQAFPVKVHDELGREKVFEFVYQPEG